MSKNLKRHRDASVSEPKEKKLKLDSEQNENIIQRKSEPEKRKTQTIKKFKGVASAVKKKQNLVSKVTNQRQKNGSSGVTKNQCVCDAAEEEPVASQLLEDHEAHVLVAEWRLHKFQSPIELKHEESISHDHFEPLEFHGHWEKRGEATFTNTGKTAVLRFKDRETPSLIGGPLHDDVYVFEQLHFHWSDDDKSGCEHIFEGLAYSMEAHAVHYNKKYSSFEEAQDKHDGLAVIGFFLEATDNDDNPCFNKLAAAVKNIIKVDTTTDVAADCLTWIKEEAQCKGYYTYQGSLTTEPYLESVTWILYPTPIHVSRRQVAAFRELKSTPCEKVKIVNNVRPIQSPPTNKKPNIFFARSHRKSE